MKMNRRFFAIGTAVTAIAVLAWCTGAAMAQQGGGGGGESETSAASGTGDATSGTSVAQTQQSGAGAGTPSTAGQPGATGTAGNSTNQTGPNQATNNLLLESPGAQPQHTQSPSGGQHQGLRPFDGQGASQTNQPATGGGRDRSLINGNTPSLAQQQRDALATINFRQAAERGLTIETLGPGSIFYDSGLRPGDVIVAVGNQPIRSQVDFERLVVSQWGQRIPARVWRNGREETIFVSFPQGMDGKMNGQLTQNQARPYQANRPIYPSSGRAFLGVGFDTGSFGMASVRDVLPGSAAEQAGLREGDIIVSLNGQPVGSYREAMQIIGSMQAGDTLEIEYTRRMPNRASAVLGGRPTSVGATGEQPIEESRFYRGNSQIEQQSPPQTEQPLPQTEQALPQTEVPPLDQGQEFPPPSQPSAEGERADDLP